MTASEMFGVPVEGMPAEVRRRAKAINFGIIYGISAFGLANQLGIPRDEAGAYIKTYFERFPGIRDYMDRRKQPRARARLRRDASSAARIHYPGDQRQEPGARGSFAERAAINAPIQGSAADIIRRAMIRMPAALAAARPDGAHAAAGARRAGVRGRRGGRRQDLEDGGESDGGRGAAGGFAEGADPRRCQGRRQLGSRALVSDASRFLDGPDQPRLCRRQENAIGAY